MSEKVKYFAAILILSPAKNSRSGIFLAASPLKSIKVSGAANTKEKNLLFLTKNQKKRSGLPMDYLTFAGNYGIYSTILYKSPGLARRKKKREQ